MNCIFLAEDIDGKREKGGGSHIKAAPLQIIFPPMQTAP